MAKIDFPNVNDADETGLLGVGGDLTVENLLTAYKKGIFPWPWNQDYIAWYSPPKRAVLYLNEVKINRTLKKILSRNLFTYSVNNNFEQVIKECSYANNRKNSNGTWITPAIISGYIDLHKAGYAVSFSSHQDKKLVGGMYGVKIKNYFSAESMFYSESNASKCALIYAFNYLRKEGVTWIDCQVINETTKKLGAKEITRDEFLGMIDKIF